MTSERDPHDRSSTDEGLATERRRTDTELANRSDAIRAVATTVVAEAREKADSVLSDARDLADQKVQANSTVQHERARADAALEGQRSGADQAACDDSERRQVALASLLAVEREYTDLRLETERERADQALTSREDFMAMVSHDLRNLLGGIALSAELLKGIGKAPDAGARIDDHAERIQRLAARMSRLVGDLMDVASIEAGKLGLVRVRRNANVLLRDAQGAFEPAAAAQGIKLTCESCGDPGFIEQDQERLLQVLTNLVNNALKFTPSGGTIVIRLERGTGELRFSVTDSGRGVPADLLDKIFERYFQAAKGDRRGLGLGLFISKSIVEGHGGTMWAENAAGGGSTFFFTIPMAPAVV